jgi:putative ABC transport system permease protein
LDRITVPRSDAVRQRYFPNEDPIGKQVELGDTGFEIVGVVGDIRRGGLREDPRADMYFALDQGPGPQNTLFIRTAGDPDRALPALEAALKSVDARATVNAARSLADVAAESVRTTKLVLWLLGIFAATALVLAAGVDPARTLAEL